jgi:hypothetical protein
VDLATLTERIKAAGLPWHEPDLIDGLVPGYEWSLGTARRWRTLALWGSSTNADLQGTIGLRVNPQISTDIPDGTDMLEEYRWLTQWKEEPGRTATKRSGGA